MQREPESNAGVGRGRPEAANSGAADDRALSAQQAGELLDRVGDAERNTPTPVPAALISLGIMCAAASLYLLARYFDISEVSQPGSLSLETTLLIFLLAWIAVAIVILFLFRERWRRGMGLRWSIYIGCWAVLWILGLVVVPQAALLWIAPLFLPLLVIAVATEAGYSRRPRIDGTRGTASRGGA
ncbi:hypothetical protein NQ038_01415 [Brevibacterium sp. 50QC2O2]|uniref:hypothetical protein n=1 Tax=Brevibacterium TaxID=1696 RepID=UPI00211C216E|nr:MULTISPECIES: hypothetical protein [unclassified Brevibacterium]MCQ9368190.1 hypothetical protein [Brevibacterium sp. 91QC2O2]MCQ9385529.1 hypothetical protein [Brevibacterium sp. 68QC2CO]MCQ9387312.1 hypothetical protein [Brevibacterium sp. 50QC2O2]